MNRTALILSVTFSCLTLPAQTNQAANAANQSKTNQDAPCVETMPGMQMCPNTASSSAPMKQDTGMTQLMDNMNPDNFFKEIEHHASAGTSAEPISLAAPMLMTMRGKWMLMLHGNAFLVDTQQTSPRGGDKLFSTNWLMPMAERRLGPGQLTLRAMFSLEPATITNRQYPLLFQQGETAFGKPIADGQHPHDFFMELALLYDLELSKKTLLSFYFAPVGDPSIGPTAYPHRASASENPVGTLGHHQEDSTHISDDVITVGLAHDFSGIGVKIEASGFHGREPDEFRWNIDEGKIDSWSSRLTLQPGKNWSGQYSYARIKSLEELFPNEDQERMTSSVMYRRPFLNGDWASTVVWGRTRSLDDDSKENSYLLESLIRFKRSNYVWTRIENAGRSNELENGANPLPNGFIERPIGHVQSYSLGYDRDVDLIPRLSTAFGAQFTVYGVADALKPIYGTDPVGIAVFLRLRPFSKGER